MNYTNQNAFVPSADSLIANVSANQTKSKINEASALSRVNVASAGRWRKLPHAAAFFILVLLLLAAAAFAPPGVWASLCAMVATAMLLIGLYLAFEVDHDVLKQTVAYFAQAADKAVSQSAREECHCRAGEQISSTQNAADQQAGEMLAAGSSLEEIRQYYSDVLSQVRTAQQTAQDRHVAACKEAETREREARQAASVFDNRARRWWPGRLLPSSARTAALRWLSALDRNAATKLEQVSISEVIVAYHVIAESLSALAGEYSAARAQVTTSAGEAAAQIQTAREHQNITGCNKFVPLPDTIAQAVEDYVQANASAIRHAIASRPSHQSLSEAIQDQAEAAAEAVRLPHTFREFYAGLNGSKALLLKQIDRQSEEFAAANPVPGRQRIRHRFLLAEGGEASQVCKDIASLSSDMLVRMADNGNPNEFVCLTEERFAPVGELPEYIEGVRHFQGLTPEKRAATIVEVEDDQIITAYSPESGLDPSRPIRLLCVGLALEIVQRTGAECYKTVNRNDPNAPHWAKGFEDAIDKLTTDDVRARQIEHAIETRKSVEGADAIRKKLLEAKTKNLVPAAAIKRFREALDDEAQRLVSEPSFAAA